jgi:hypothetical protein
VQSGVARAPPWSSFVGDAVVSCVFCAEIISTFGFDVVPRGLT